MRRQGQQFCESWNNDFSNLVGDRDSSPWALIETLQEEENTASTVILQAASGQPLKKRVKRCAVQAGASIPPKAIMHIAYSPYFHKILFTGAYPKQNRQATGQIQRVRQA